MKRLMKNKKGTALTDIISTFTDIISTFLSTLPRPLQLIIFLLLILLIGNIVQFALNVFGIFCDSGNNPVSVGFNVIESTSLMFRSTNMFRGQEDDFTKLEKLVSCSNYYENYTFLADEGSLLGFKVPYSEILDWLGVDYSIDKDIAPARWFYNPSPCVKCDVTFIRLNGGDVEEVCEGDAYPIINKSFFQKVQCDLTAADICELPDNYFYSYLSNTYVCSISDCDIAAKDQWDKILRDSGAEYMYAGGVDGSIAAFNDYTRAVGVKCEELKPKIAFFGIVIFDYKIWMLIGILGVLFWVYWKIKKA